MKELLCIVVVSAFCAWVSWLLRDERREEIESIDDHGRPVCHHSFGLAGGFSRCSACGRRAIKGEVRR